MTASSAVPRMGGTARTIEPTTADVVVTVAVTAAAVAAGKRPEKQGASSGRFTGYFETAVAAFLMRSATAPGCET